ncbi:hypothetical protein BV898_10500 [Hypsibius exemplaris]|uniref:Uncharacterized protein n=1 Tax=Hypsibius exemplaris TaxID=2072580 RepID=A0A1W0WJ93_HYPEX|nr:hypothetical protein BV898_10500 [Hypsibius exemplaris]
MDPSWKIPWPSAAPTPTSPSGYETVSFPSRRSTRQKQSIRRISFSHDGRFVATMADLVNYIDVALVETGRGLGLS